MTEAPKACFLRLMVRNTRPARMAVLENADLLELIFKLGKWQPKDIVRLGRVNKAWRSVCHENPQLMLCAVRRCKYLTKTTLMGSLALSSAEANGLPHERWPRFPSGHMCLYIDWKTVDNAWEIVGGTAEWQRRLEK